MEKKIINIIPLQEDVSIYAKFKDIDDKHDGAFSACHWIAIYDDGSYNLLCFDEDCGIEDPEIADNFDGYVSPSASNFISFSELIMRDCSPSSRLGRLKNWLNTELKEGRIK